MRTFVVFVGAAALALFVFACGVEPEVTCSDDGACFEGYRCDDATDTCLRACDSTAAGDCLASQFCDAPAGDTEGVCRQDDGASNENENNG